MHASQKTVLNSLRQKYWFIGRFMYVKNLVRKLCKKTCGWYIRYMTLGMSPLSLIWLDNPETGSNVGVTYLVLIFCKAEWGEGGTIPCQNTANVKAWVSLFICLHSPAIHCKIAPIQLSSSLSDGSSPWRTNQIVFIVIMPWLSSPLTRSLKFFWENAWILFKIMPTTKRLRFSGTVTWLHPGKMVLPNIWLELSKKNYSRLWCRRECAQ